MKVANGYEIIQQFEKIAPKSLAYEGDKIGLQVGTLNKPIKKIMVTLDVVEDVIEEAVQNDVDLIIAHHPLIFHPLKSIVTDHAHGRIIETCLKHDITIYVAHTNLDIAYGGVNDMLADALGLTNTDVLVETSHESLQKLVVFVPKSHAEKVREALGDAGAGYIGNYSHCTFQTEGTGTFKPNKDASPYIGESGKLEMVEEVRIETIIPTQIKSKTLKAMLNAHPYEEVAYDIIPLENKGKTYGLGKIGYLQEEMTLAQFASHVKAAFSVDGVRVVGDLSSTVRKVAVVGGDGNKYISKAKFKGADVYVTGDMYFHTAHDAKMLGLSIVDPGHHVESIMKQGVTDLMSNIFKINKFDVEIFPSAINTDPFRFL
ncbi:Nif3-like dinuclear metal center hexameric protein [Bacillus sp. HMF5848]|uniref:Nif3-like dinuclear metal center hexameric protein n=1 Tax=Bacillus sp. HMF5848 TaxID=2495421 RepID=UPI000F766C32|nr:Nif3-like dinuclear metal center hexameric protein [Bacillus sp. HMF5848]RSK27872.1 Nif3-like dinuclear metal center hexameric protein [Bacillus sp. HMF5848]